MAGKCQESQYWDGLLKKCLPCKLACWQTHVNSRCISYCESSHCKTLPGHYYDLLLKKCMKCADICGRHPAECSQHCHTSTAQMTTEMLKATGMQTSRELSVMTGLDYSNILIYSLLALCMVLVVSSLCIALAVFPRRAKKTASDPEPKKANPKREAGPPRGQKSFNALVNSSHPNDREPSEEPNPTETCVCVHCFPDLKALGQCTDGPLRAPFTFYQQANHKAQTQKGGPVWTEDSLYSSGIEVHEEAAVG